jgi:HEAT repeat protein
METPASALAEYAGHLPTQAELEARTGTYIDDAVARHGIPALLEAVVRATESRDPEATRGAWLFIRDAAIHGLSAHEVSDAVRRELPGSGFFDALEQCLHDPAFAVRSGAVYTFGKLGFPENASRLARALRARRDLDPFLLPGLLAESRWLEGRAEGHWERVREVAVSPQELSRWASLQVLGEARDGEDAATALEQARLLEQDPSEFIRAEAVYVVALLAAEVRRAGRGFVSKEEWARAGRGAERQERRRVAALRPKVTFGELAHRFTLTLGEPDYRLEDVVAFLRSFRS